MSVIADTDVLIDFLRGRGAAEEVAIELRTGALQTTAITAFELWAGAKGPKQAKVVEPLLDVLTIVGLDGSSARRAAHVRMVLERKGSGIGMADSLIAGICLDVGAVLLTRNQRHFERVEGLRLRGG